MGLNNKRISAVLVSAFMIALIIMAGPAGAFNISASAEEVPPAEGGAVGAGGEAGAGAVGAGGEAGARNLCVGVECNDDNVCTLDSCDSITGECVFENVPDGTPCGENRECRAGVCVELLPTSPAAGPAGPTGLFALLGLGPEADLPLLGLLIILLMLISYYLWKKGKK